MFTTTIRTLVHAQWETVWELLRDRIENPQRYQPLILASKVIERSPDGIIREVNMQDMVIRERISLNDKEKTIRSELLEHPLYNGTIDTRLLPTSTQNPMAPLYLEFGLKLELKANHLEGTVRPEVVMEAALKEELEIIRKKAEKLER